MHHVSWNCRIRVKPPYLDPVPGTNQFIGPSCLVNGPLLDDMIKHFAGFLLAIVLLKADTPPSTQKGTEELTSWTPSPNECVFD
jgi:hypothetical protein